MITLTMIPFIGFHCNKLLKISFWIFKLNFQILNNVSGIGIPKTVSNRAQPITKAVRPIVAEANAEPNKSACVRLKVY